LVDDDSGEILRTVVLYRRMGDNFWTLAELTYDPDTGWAEGTVPAVDGPIEYFAQAVDPTGNVALALDHGNPFRELTDGQPLRIYLPVALRNYLPAPDLVVERIIATGNSVQVVIGNQGNVDVTDEFWVQAYIDPDTPPSAVNQLWYDLGDQGVFWGVTSSALPIAPGDTITLTSGGDYYWPSHSRFYVPLPPGTPVYAQVDSWNPATSYGAVLEDHEILWQAYNNIGGPSLSTAGGAGSAAVGSPSIGGQSSASQGSGGNLPPIPESSIHWISDDLMPSRGGFVK
jgi:hypothetical protein